MTETHQMDAPPNAATLGTENRFWKAYNWKKIPSPAVYPKSPGRTLYKCNNHQAMITFTDFDARCFDFVLAIFANMFDAFTPFLDGKITWLEQNTCGCKRMIQPEDSLGLVLGWTILVDLWWHFNSFLEWLWWIYWCIYTSDVSWLLKFLTVTTWLISVPSKEKIKEC